MGAIATLFDAEGIKEFIFLDSDTLSPKLFSSHKNGIMLSLSQTFNILFVRLIFLNEKIVISPFHASKFSIPKFPLKTKGLATKIFCSEAKKFSRNFL